LFVLYKERTYKNSGLQLEKYINVIYIPQIFDSNVIDSGILMATRMLGIIDTLLKSIQWKYIYSL